MARLNNLLVATTAMVAFATAASATTISTSQTSVVQTSSSVGGITISGASVINTSGGGTSAIEISGTVATAASNTVNIGSSATLTTSQVAGTIQVMDGSAGAVTINNSGTVINTGTNGNAISNSTPLASAMTINNAGSISGSIRTGGGADVFNQSAGAISGTIDFGAAADTMTITGGTISGSIDFGTGTDVLNVSGTGFTTTGSITNLETVNVSSTLNVSGSGFGSNLTNVRVDSSGTLNVSADTVVNSGGVFNVSGTMNIAAGKIVSASVVDMERGVLGVHIDSSSSYGRIEQVGGTGASFRGGSMTIHLGNTFINSGTQFRLISNTAGTGAAVLPSLTTTSSGLYTFSLATAGTNNQDISLTIYRQATSNVANTATNKAIGATLDSVSSSTNAQFVAIQGLLNDQVNAAGVNTVLEKLNPAVDTGAALASVDVATQTGGQISTRLASLRGGNSVNTGDGVFGNHFWTQGFGNMTEQDDKDGRRGYDANTIGGSFGLDTDTLIDGATTGAAFSYGKSNVESNAAGNAETDVDNYLITLYGSRVYDQGVFINALGSVGFGQYETSRNTGVGIANGEFDGMQYSAKLEAGKDYTCDWWTLTPAASAQYTYVDMDSYRETGAGGANLNVDSESFNALDLALGGTAAYNIPLESGGTLSPRMRAKVIYRAGDDSVETSSRFVGGGAAFKTQGVEADRTSLNLGAGMLLTTVGGVDLSADYDAEIRDSLTGHTGQVKARWAF